MGNDRDSKGCCAEYAYALAKDIPIYEIVEGENDTKNGFNTEFGWHKIVPTTYIDHWERILLKKMKPDNINHPEHYCFGGIETIEYIKAKLSPEEYRGYMKGSVIKYLSRAGHKDDVIQDLKKAQWYLNRLIQERDDNVHS